MEATRGDRDCGEGSGDTPQLIPSSEDLAEVWLRIERLSTAITAAIAMNDRSTALRLTAELIEAAKEYGRLEERARAL